MNACGQCKFWDPLSFRSPDEPYHAGSEADPDNRNLDAEPGIAWGSCGRENHPGSRMGTNDASDYRSWFYTRQDFGCVQWEQRP